MKKQWLLLLLVIQIFFFNIANSQTYIPAGSVWGNWNVEESPYIILGNIDVPTDSTLVIDNGVTVLFNYSFGFTVYGTLRAEGEENSKIYFLGNYDYAWKGIKFSTESGQPATTSYISYTEIDCFDVENIESIAINFTKHNIASIHHCTINNADIGIKVSSCAQNNDIINCEFHNVSEGIVIDKCDILQKVEICSCNFFEIWDRAITITQNQAFLQEIIISNCHFENSDITNNSVREAIYIWDNTLLNTLTLQQDTVLNFSKNPSSLSAISIINNSSNELNVSMVSCQISNCGGDNSASSQYGGLFIDWCTTFNSNSNTFNLNYGTNSGACCISANSIFHSNNYYNTNENNVQSRDYGGACTFSVLEEIVLTLDAFNDNASNFSGGALLIKGFDSGNSISITLNNEAFNDNSSLKEGGAIYITGAINNLQISNSDFNNNNSPTGGGGIFLSSANINSLLLSNNTFLDNWVNSSSYGGILYITHNPSIQPYYGSFKFENNTTLIEQSISNRNYSFLYSLANRLPDSIYIKNDSISNCFSNEAIYYFTYFENQINPNICYFINDSSVYKNNENTSLIEFDHTGSTLDISSKNNYINNCGTYITAHTNRLNSITVDNDALSGIVSGNNGGCFSINVLQEVGPVIIKNTEIQQCYSEGNGGHFWFNSGASDDEFKQKLIINNCSFDNVNWNTENGGDGGSIYFSTPGNIDSVYLYNTYVSNIISSGNGAGFFINANKISSVVIEGCEFTHLKSSTGSGGAVFLNSTLSGIDNLQIIPSAKQATDFSNCEASNSGGAVYANAALEIGPVDIAEVSFYGFNSEIESGGALYLHSSESDPTISQQLNINATHFNNLGNTSPIGGMGGAVYYHTFGDLDSVIIKSCNFEYVKSIGNGGGIYLIASDIGSASISSSLFTSCSSTEGSSGAVYFQATEGNIDSLLLTGQGADKSKFLYCNSKSDGGALFADAEKEIGPVIIKDVEIVDCFSETGNGGAFYLNSKYANDLPQFIWVKNSLFNNSGLTEITGGDGGAIYYNTPGLVDSVTMINNEFESIASEGSGGGIYVNAHSIEEITLHGCSFTSLQSKDNAGGAAYFESHAGNIGSISLLSLGEKNNSFISCNSKENGGALSIIANKEIGPANILNVHFLDCYSSGGDGGGLHFKSAGNDPGLNQYISLEGITFDNTNISDVTGGNGGAISYLTSSSLDSCIVTNSTFNDIVSYGNGGALSVTAENIKKVLFSGVNFQSIKSVNGSGGAVYMNSSDGNIESLKTLPYVDNVTLFSGCEASSDGGALSASASGNIGKIGIMQSEFFDCFSESGNGGCLYLSSSGANPFAQHLMVDKSLFDNTQLSEITGGSGGAIYYSSNVQIDSVTLLENQFLSTNSSENGGAVYVMSNQLSLFESFDNFYNNTIATTGSGGGIYIDVIGGETNAFFSGNIFSFCTSGLFGGSIYYSNSAEIINGQFNSTNNVFKGGQHTALPDYGGGVFLSGIDTVTFSNDTALNLHSTSAGGFCYLTNTNNCLMDGLYAYKNVSDTGGVICHNGYSVNTNELFKINNSNLLFNSASLLGGALYFSNVESVLIGDQMTGNTFVGNESTDPYNSKGGAFYISNGQSLNISYNSFYTNHAGDNGGAGYIVSGESFGITNNDFIGNTASSGGALQVVEMINQGTISDNYFYLNRANEQGGVFVFSPGTVNSIEIKDNTFFKNSSNVFGGTIASYRPLKSVRNLFRENHLTNRTNNDAHGTALYFDYKGVNSIIKNCIFDNNLSLNEKLEAVYYNSENNSLPDSSVFNCSFFNQDEYLSLFNNSLNSTLGVLNTIFTIKNIDTSDTVEYFNDKVAARYSNLVYGFAGANSTNISKYVHFNNGDYYFDSLSVCVDVGNPLAIFNDYYRPPGHKLLLNDMGVSGGPDNPEDTLSFLFSEPKDPLLAFDVIITGSECFTFNLECRSDSIASFNKFFWFFPEEMVETNSPSLDYTFSDNNSGNAIVTVLSQDTDAENRFGFGQCTINLDILLIDSIYTLFNNNQIAIESTPFDLMLYTSVHAQPNATLETEWNVLSLNNLDISMIHEETYVAEVRINKIYGEVATAYIEYVCKLVECEIERRDTIELIVTAGNWGEPFIKFIPETDIINQDADIIIEFSKLMTDLEGNFLENDDVETYLDWDCNGCLTEFSYNIVNEDKTIITIYPDDTLDTTDYTITVLGSQLISKYYQLFANDTSKTYTVVDDTGILGLGGDSFAEIYPNPFQDKIKLNFNKTDDYSIEIFDTFGAKVFESKIKNKISELIHLGGLPDGVYIVHIENLSDRIKTSMNVIKINNIK